jgi:hypothetical protein
LKRSKPFMLIPRPRIIKNNRHTQILPTLHLSLRWSLLIPSDDVALAQRLLSEIRATETRTNNFLLNRCRIAINAGAFPALGLLLCGPGERIPCITQLTERGNAGMANLINDQSLRPPQTFRNVPLLNVIVVAGGRFIDNPSLLGTTLTFGQPNRYSIYIFLVANALSQSNPWILAHEIGHALLNRTFGSFPPHNRDPLNLMHSPVPRVSDPIRIKLTSSQIQAFRNSSLLSRRPL